MAINLPEAQVQKSLSLAEEKALNEKINYLEDVRDGVEIKDAQGVTHEVKDPKALEENIRRLKSIRDTQSVEMATGSERVALEKEEALLRERLDPGMSWDEYMNTKRRDGMRFIKLVNKIQQWNSDAQRQSDIKRWKYIRRRLDPQDPNASNTMNLFKE